MPFLDEKGLGHLWNHIVTRLNSKANKEDLDTHADDKSNPHEVTLPQLGVTVEAAELNYMDGVTSCVQDQLDAKADKSDAVIAPLAAVGQTIIVKEVDENGKPTAWESADYQPRTHWKEQGQEDIVPEVTLTPFLNENMGVYIHPLAPFELEEGKTYTVIFDGASYTCTAFAGALDESMPFIAIGNAAIAGGANTGEPFALGVFNAVRDELVAGIEYMLACFDSNKHTVRVIEDKIVPHKIPEEYVTPSVFNVIFYADSTHYLLMLTPWDDVIGAVRSGKNIYCRITEESYNYDQYGELHAYYWMSQYACMEAKVGKNTLECSLKFVIFNSVGVATIMTVARDKNGVTTITLSD